MSDIISLTGGRGAMNKIGIFFICSNSEIIANHIPYKKGRFLNGLYDSNSDHWELFDSLIFKFDTDDYINVPRGRVIFDERNNQSIIYIDECYLSDEKVLKKIIKLFQVKNYVIKTDIHYQCPNCLGNIWDD